MRINHFIYFMPNIVDVKTSLVSAYYATLACSLLEHLFVHLEREEGNPHYKHSQVPQVSGKCFFDIHHLELVGKWKAGVTNLVDSFQLFV